RAIFKDVDDGDFLRTAEEIAMYHHERWDGTGYPKGLKGEEIPLCARLMAVADVFDALVSTRVYKPPFKPTEAINIMMSESGTHFDPDIMETFYEMRDEFVKTALLPFEKLQ
ncbi:MAG: HD domain-containing protein, partial [Clostridia bacterium]|nr:HD domain-containing protein [Clostridia bacterium]